MAPSAEMHAVAAELLSRLAAVGRNAAIYPSKHPMVTEPAREVAELARVACGESPQIIFHVINSELYFNKQLLPEETVKYSYFIQFLTERGINSLTLNRDVEPDMIARFFTVLSEDGGPASGIHGMRRRTKEANIRGIGFEDLVALDLLGNVFDLAKKEEAHSLASQSYQAALERLEALENDIVANASFIDTQDLQKAVAALMGDFLSNRDAILGIMSIKNYDKHLFYHSVNVTIIALLIGLKLSLSEEQMKIVGLSGLLHDVGKLKIPHEIISKSGPLTESEWEMVRRHPIEGANLLMRYESVPDLAILTSLEHHVGYDLSGYPSVRDKDRPHLFIRIIGVADAYEAMTANRSYRSAQTMDRAIKVLLDCSGSQFDPLLVKALLNIVGIFPPGSLVRLKNGASAVVAEPNEDNPFYPKVRAAEDFSRISADTPLINTADDPSQYAIVSVADSPDI